MSASPESCDVLVVGAGAAGWPAALGAARAGTQPAQFALADPRLALASSPQNLVIRTDPAWVTPPG